MKKTNYQRLTNFTLNEFVGICEDLQIEKFKVKTHIAGKRYRTISIRKKHWLHLIKTDNLICPVTNKKVFNCSLDIDNYTKTFHYNFYSEDGELFTIDHITPKAKGGTNAYENIQPMTAIENFKKSDKICQ